MTIQEWIPAVSTTFLFGLAVWLFRKLIVTRLAKSVQHEFDNKLEVIQAELRRSEESFKADLRSKENQIAALRGGALSALASRQAVLDKRRLEAVEQIWEAVTSLARLKYASQIMGTIKFDVASAMAAKDPKMREAFEVFATPMDKVDTPENKNAEKARPFVPQIAWALFSAYRAIILLAVTQFHLLKSGLDGTKLLAAPENLIKAALPHRTEYIEKHGYAAYSYLLDELESRLLAELQKMFEGGESGKATIDQASAIVKEVDRAMESARSANAETP